MSMTPNQLHELNAFVDGELELTKQLDLEARLVIDASLRDEVASLRTLRAGVRARADYHAAPEALRARRHPPATAASVRPMVESRTRPPSANRGSCARSSEARRPRCAYPS